MSVDVRHNKPPTGLCQNCVRYPPETLEKSIIYGDLPKQIVVAEVVDRKVCWKDSLCVSTRGGSRFPSVLDRPLRHLSAFRINELRAAWIRIAQNRPSRTSNLTCRMVPIGYGDAHEVVDIQLCQTF